MNITVKYFAKLAEIANTTKETLELETQSVEDLYQQLRTKYKFPYKITEVRAAINTKYVDPHTELQHNDTVVFITPVAGG